ncbi:MAG: hypothetical protein M1834_003089 [Cirrosporium novae-zelandiae]|nr:MAG: hypothetical protein M1834_003089 [Cirrosporium novae-zelandiae]
MFPSQLRRAVASSKPPRFNIYTNPYKAKKEWPPDLQRLSHKHQFRLEKKYRRRAKLKYTNENWNKTMRMAQWISISGVVFWAIFFMDSDRGKNQPFNTFRQWVQRKADLMWTTSVDRSGRGNLP